MQNNFTQRVTQIKGLSDRRRLPRLGIIRLGLKMQGKNGGKEYPKETPFFVCPDDVKKVYGNEPTEIDIMLPINDQAAVFPQSYKYYGSSKGLKCQGDGECAYYVDEKTKEMKQKPCPCELLDAGKCKQTGTLMFMIPKVSVGGIYQITTSSFNSIVDLNSGLDYVSALLGRFALVPLKLRRIPTETHHDEKKQTHFTMQIIFDADINTLNALRSDTTRVLEHPRYQLPPPENMNPEFDPIDGIEDEEGTITTTASEVKKEGPDKLTAENLSTIRDMLKGIKTTNEKMICRHLGVKVLEEAQAVNYESIIEGIKIHVERAKTNGNGKGKITEAEAQEIDKSLSEFQLSVAAFKRAFDIENIVDLPADKMEEARKWINTEVDKLG